eukprot:3889115-Ditylum_brightwellii.AAC.1
MRACVWQEVYNWREMCPVTKLKPEYDRKSANGMKYKQQQKKTHEQNRNENAKRAVKRDRATQDV